MKKKFESNVASEIPRTKLHEPELPWKLNEDDMAQASSRDDDVKSLISGAPPLKTSVPVIVLLVIAIFGITAYLVVSAMTDNERMRSNIARKEGELSLVQMSLVRVAAEKEAFSKNTAQLEKKVSDLTAQKQLFANIIESLTKKGEDIDTPPAAPILTMTPPASPDAAPAAAQNQ